MKGRNFLIAVAITLAFACIVLLLFHPSHSPLGGFFDVFIILIVTYYIAIVSGIVAILLRILKAFKDNSRLIYVFAGTLNIFLAIVGITLFMTDRADIEWLHKAIANLLVGFLILADAFLLQADARK